MKIDFSKEFIKASKKLSGKILKSLNEVIKEVTKADSIDELTDCKKIESLNSVYRLRIGSKRAFFVLHIEIDGDVVIFEYLVSRGEAYSKKNMDRLRNKDI